MAVDEVEPGTQSESLEAQECDVILDASEPLRQGDVFAWTDSAAPWRRFGLIVTADCDFANDKLGGIISYTPILALGDYLQHVYMPRQLIAGKRRLLLRSLALMRRLRPALAPESAESILHDAGADIPTVMQVTDEHSASKLRDLHAAFLRTSSLLEGRDSPSLHAQVQARIGAEMALGSSADAARNRVLGDTKTSVTRAPEDCFFLSRLTPELNEGYVAYLRLIREAALNSISSRLPPSGETTHAVRVARLRAPYLYSLTRRLADVFASIGLPDEYEHTVRVRGDMVPQYVERLLAEGEQTGG